MIARLWILSAALLCNGVFATAGMTGMTGTDAGDDSWYTAADSPIIYDKIIPFKVGEEAFNALLLDFSERNNLLAMQNAGFKFDNDAKAFVKDTDEPTKLKFWSFVMSGAEKAERAFVTEAPITALEASEGMLVLGDPIVSMREMPGFPGSKADTTIQVGTIHTPLVIDARAELKASSFAKVTTTEGEGPHSGSWKMSSDNKILYVTSGDPDCAPATGLPNVSIKTRFQVLASVATASPEPMNATYWIKDKVMTCFFVNVEETTDGTQALSAMFEGDDVSIAYAIRDHVLNDGKIVKAVSDAEGKWTVSEIQTDAGSIGMLDVTGSSSMWSTVAMQKYPMDEYPLIGRSSPVQLAIQNTFGQPKTVEIVWQVPATIDKPLSVRWGEGADKVVTWTLKDAGGQEGMFITTLIQTDNFHSVARVLIYGGQNYSGATSTMSSLSLREMGGQLFHRGLCGGLDWVQGVGAEGMCLLNEDMSKSWAFSAPAFDLDKITFMPSHGQVGAYSLSDFAIVDYNPATFRPPGNNDTIPKGLSFLAVARTLKSDPKVTELPDEGGSDYTWVPPSAKTSEPAASKDDGGSGILPVIIAVVVVLVVLGAAGAGGFLVYQKKMGGGGGGAKWDSGASGL